MKTSPPGWWPRLKDLFPDSAHVRDHKLANRPDSEVWRFAASGGFAIVSKDEDFHHLAFLRGAPPKVIGIGLGNCTTASIEALLRAEWQRIRLFLSDSDSSFLALP